MYHQDQKQNVVVNFNIDKVFDAIIRAAENLSGFKVKNSNRITHSITINISASFFSWGEQMTVSLNALSQDKTEIYFSSGSKLGTELVANTKNRKNIDNLMNAMSMYLA